MQEQGAAAGGTADESGLGARLGMQQQQGAAGGATADESGLLLEANVAEHVRLMGGMDTAEQEDDEITLNYIDDFERTTYPQHEPHGQEHNLSQEQRSPSPPLDTRDLPVQVPDLKWCLDARPAVPAAMPTVTYDYSAVRSDEAIILQFAKFRTNRHNPTSLWLHYVAWRDSMIFASGAASYTRVLWFLERSVRNERTLLSSDGVIVPAGILSLYSEFCHTQGVEVVGRTCMQHGEPV